MSSARALGSPRHTHLALLLPAPAAAADCAAGPAQPTAANRASLTTLAWRSGRLTETGWEIYAPLAAREIGSPCPPASQGFAAALARWQGAHHLPASGVMDAASLAALDTLWMRRRPFVEVSARACPAPPPADRLTWAAPRESYGQPVALRPGALAAYRAMVAAARRDLPRLSGEPRLMSLVSGFRSPEADAARCAAEQNCQGVTRASCSAHRTGLAMDLNLGALPGEAPTSASPANRLFIARGVAYRWMVANAGRFGFVPYPFEPWHWEWTGEAP